DALVVEIVRVEPRASFGWTAIRPGRGLLPEGEFPKPFLQLWDLADTAHARMGHGIAVPIEPFPGVVCTALDLPGGPSPLPPRPARIADRTSRRRRTAPISLPPRSRPSAT